MQPESPGTSSAEGSVTANGAVGLLTLVMAHLAVQCEDYASQQADKGVQQVEHFLSCPPILGHALLDANELHNRHKRNDAIRDCKGQERVLQPVWIIVNPLPPSGQSTQVRTGHECLEHRPHFCRSRRSRCELILDTENDEQHSTHQKQLSYMQIVCR